MSLRDLPTLGELQARPRATPKPMPHLVTKKSKQATQKRTEAAFRAAVWKRDEGKSRASGRKLSRSAMDWDTRGEVHHVLKRSTNPEGKWLPARGILLSKTEHKLAETRCPQAPEHHMLEILGGGDLGQLQAFVWRDVNGVELKRRIG